MKKSEWILAGVLLVNFLLILFTSQITLKNFPNSSDEYSQYISAKLFSEGRLSVPSPPQKDFFFFFNLVNNGKYYGKYPPGWPFIWSIGILLNISWLLNPIFGVLTLIVIYLIAKENFSDRIANIAIILTLFNPYIIFNSASYFSHPAALFFLSLFVYFYFKSFNTASKLNYAMLGITSGVGFLIRPYTAVAIILPFAVYSAYNSIKKRRLKQDMKLFSIAFTAFLLFFALFLLYNYLQTGDPLLQPFNVYRPCDKIGITNCSFDLTFGTKNNLIFRLLKLNHWVPLSVFLLIFYLFKKKEWKGMLLFSTFASLFIAYFFYFFLQGNEYGPRYLYEASFAIFTLMAISLKKFGKKTQYFVVAIILVLNIASLYVQTNFYAHQVENRLTLYRLVENKNISNAVVFIRNGIDYMMRAPELTRNGIYFNESVLYVLDKNESNKELMKEFPDRNFYYFTYNQANKTGQILPYS